MELYDNSSDPLDHLEGYKALMMLQGASDTLLLFAFWVMLQNLVQIWYFGLQSESIYSYEQLRMQFIAYFGNDWASSKNSDNLFSIQ